MNYAEGPCGGSGVLVGGLILVLVLMRGGRMRLSRSGGMRVGVDWRTFFSFRWDGGGVRTVIEKMQLGDDR